jgi:hypothetical protein
VHVLQCELVLPDEVNPQAKKGDGGMKKAHIAKNSTTMLLTDDDPQVLLLIPAVLTRAPNSGR